MALVSVKGLTKSFQGRTVVDNLNMEIEAGEILGFLGPNGAGKTTTVRMMAGMISCDSGETWLDGVKTAVDSVETHRKTGLLTESPGFYPRLTAWENLRFFGQFYPGVMVAERAEETLKQMGLWERRHDRVGNFSKGMKQKLSLCRALLHEPPVVFLDEPTSGLDPEARVEVRNLVRQLKAEKRAVLLCTHYLDEAECLCDRVAVFRTSLLALDKPAVLQGSFFGRRMTAECGGLTDAQFEAVQRTSGLQGLSRQGNNIYFTPPDFADGRFTALQALLAAGCRVLSFREEEHSLEEVYLTLMQEGRDEDR